MTSCYTSNVGILGVIVCENLCPWLYFFVGWRIVFEHAGWERICLEWMLPAECGLVSCQRPLKDKLPNAAGFVYKSSSLLLWTYACCVLQPISIPYISLVALSLPFRFFIFPPAVAHNLWQCHALFQLCHHAVTRSTPCHVYLPLLLLVLSVNLFLTVFFFFLPMSSYPIAFISLVFRKFNVFLLINSTFI